MCQMQTVVNQFSGMGGPDLSQLRAEQSVTCPYYGKLPLKWQDMSELRITLADLAFSFTATTHDRHLSNWAFE